MSFLWLATALVISACGGGGRPDSVPAPVPEPAAAASSDTPVEAVVDPVALTMGKVVAVRYADLSFESDLPIERVLVRNGQRVRRGQVLASLEGFPLRNAVEQQQIAVEQAQLQVEQAHLQMLDVIITQGYDPDRAGDVPEQVARQAEVKSGHALAKAQLSAAQSQLAAARHDLDCGTLTAPFSGVVANVSVQPHQHPEAGTPVCRIIDDSEMAVEFRVMEADLDRYPLGTRLNAIPVSDPSRIYTATVSQINPVVDEQGAVTLRARLADATGLFDGMNVEVILQH